MRGVRFRYIDGLMCTLSCEWGGDMSGLLHCREKAESCSPCDLGEEVLGQRGYVNWG